jgi:competence protein ComEC
VNEVSDTTVGWAKTLFPALSGLVVGSALQLQQADLSVWPIYASLMLVATVWYARTASKNIANRWRAVQAFLALALFGLGLVGLRSALYAEQALNPALEGRDVLVTGVVVSMPQRNEAGLRFRLDVELAQLDGQTVALPALMDVGWYGGAFSAGPAVLAGADSVGGAEQSMPVLGLNRMPADVQAGERWQMTLRIKAPHGSRNPFGFDYELWLWEQGVQTTGYVRAGPKDPDAVRLGQTWRHPVALARQSLRERIVARVEQRQFAGMIAALVVGDQNAIDRVDWDVFRATGVAHLVSISGLHITMFAWLAALLLGWLWRRSARLCLAFPAPSAALLGGVVLAALYALFSGWGVPAQRTCLMLATVALLRLSGARWPWPHVWMLACAVVVASDPWALLQAGFWLSFVAVGVLFATDSGAAHAKRTGAGGLIDKIFSNLREQWVITVTLTPLTLLLFGQVSVVGLAANALAIPWITLVVTPLAMLGVLLPVLWELAAVAIGWLVAYLQWLASWPWAAMSLAVPPLWVGAAGVLGGLVAVLPWPWSMRALGLPLLLPVLLWRAPLPPPGQFELLAADIGQGNAVLVRTANHALLFDAGPRYSLESDAGHRVLVPLLQALHTRLDTVVLSHRDMDHVGGAPAVLAMNVEAQLWSSIESDNLLQSLRNVQRCQAGQQWNWDGVGFEVLHPQAADYEEKLKSNAMSCVLRISNGRQTALLAGDIEQAQEARLVAQSGRFAAGPPQGETAPSGGSAARAKSAVADSGEVASVGATPLKADVLLAPHHGSKTSSSGALLDAVAPRLAIVQSGYRNRFGHPAVAVLERYRERGITVVDSPHCGAFTWQSWRPERPQNEACHRTTMQRYWHHRVP